MIGARCADLIAEAVVSMEFKASAEDISRMSHAHPTFAEAVKEAAQQLQIIEQYTFLRFL
jgi:dihydrolipoamide dehydrogenase